MSAASIMADTSLKAAVVRNEINDVLKSDRLNLLGSCEAHVFKLEDGKWVDLTGEPVLVHLIRDNLEGMTKMLAVYTHKLVVDNVPLSSNFNVFTPSKKFLQFVCNKFDKNSENYGFGFAGLSDMEMFLQLLARIKQMAMASLTPSLYGTSMHSSNMNSAMQNIPSNAPLGFTGSPMKSTVRPSEYESLSIRTMFNMDEPLSPHPSEGAHSHFSSSDKSLDIDKNMAVTASDSHTMSTAEAEFIDYASNEMSSRSNMSSNLQTGGQSHGTTSFNRGRSNSLILGGGEMPLYSFAERRLTELIASFDMSSNSQPYKPDDAKPSNCPGPIGSPIKRHAQ